MWLNPFFPTPACCGPEVGSAVKTQLFSPLLCESGQTVRQLKTWTQTVLMPCTALKWAVMGTLSGLCLFDEPGRAELVIRLELG